jgi:hypothetical protein
MGSFYQPVELLLAFACTIGRSAKLLLLFGSTVIPGFSLFEIHDQNFCSPLYMYVF